jgi:exonuclease VII small subunit
MANERFERVERLRAALEGLKNRQEQYDRAKAVLEQAERAFKLAEVVLATAREEVEKATEANKSDGTD